LNDQPEPKDPKQDAALRNYLLLCLTALVVILLVLVRIGIRGPSLLVPLIGVLGLSMRWRLAPLFTLITLAGVLYWNERPHFFRISESQTVRPFSLPDWILCGTTLAYVVAHYRYLGLTGSVFPSDPRKDAARDHGAGEALPGLPRTGQSARPISQAEVGWLVLSLPVWASLSQLVWQLLPPKSNDSIGFLSILAYQGLVLAWVLGLGALFVTGLLSYIRQRQMTRTEAKLLLQDTLWLETCREQRNVNRWLAWARLRRNRRKE